MSQRSSFTSEYIYNREDYKIIRDKANEWGNGKYLNFAPAASYDDFEMPIISGKVGGLYPTEEAEILKEFIKEINVEFPVTFIILPESHDFSEHPTPIIKLTKMPSGAIIRTNYKGIDTENEYEV